MTLQPRSPVWGPRSGAAAPPASSRTSQNADCILIMGSNMAENHPVGLPVGDGGQAPRRARSSTSTRASRARARSPTCTCAIRAGSDIAFLGGADPLRPRERPRLQGVRRAPTRTRRRSSPRTSGTPRTSTACSPAGTPRRSTYDPSSWQYEGMEVSAAAGEREHAARPPASRPTARTAARSSTASRRTRDETLAAPALRLPDPASGTSPATRPRWSRRSAASRASSSSRWPRRCATTRAASARRALCYAVGWTQHTVGVQNIRTAAILQLLLGNIGRPGRRHHGPARARVDPGLDRHPDALRPPARLPADAARRGATTTLDDYVEQQHAAGRLLGQLARLHRLAAEGVVGRRGDRGERLRLRPPAAHRPATTPTTRRCLGMVDGDGRGLLRHGREPGRRRGQRRAAPRRRWRSLEWLVVRDLVEIETASFWRDAPEIETGELRTEDIDTEVFLLPAATHVEKAGTFTNTQRLLQWRDQAVEPPRRLPLGAVVHVPPRARACASSWPDSSDPTRPGRPRPHLGLPDRGRRRRARRRGGPARDQRLRPPTGKAAARLHCAQGRRLDRVRLLDLRRLLRRRRQPGRAAQARLASRRGWRPSGAGRGR